MIYIPLIFSFTNLLPASFALLALGAFSKLIIDFKIKRHVIYVGIFILYLITSIFINYKNVFEISILDFLRRDGKLITIGAMFILFSILSNVKNHNKQFVSAIYTLNILNILFLLIYSSGYNYIQVFSEKNISSEIYRFGFEAHNSAAAYLLGLFILTIMLPEIKKLHKFLFSFFIFISIYYAHSRGIYISLFVFLIMHVFRVKNLGLLLIFGYILVSFIIGEISLFLFGDNNDLLGRGETIRERIFHYYPLATSLFHDNLLFGIGFGKFDDIDNLIVHTDAHAHNSLLHVLAELGLIGFLLLIILLYKILGGLNKNSRHHFKFIFIPFLYSGISENTFTSPVAFTLVMSYFFYLYNKQHAY